MSNQNVFQYDTRINTAISHLCPIKLTMQTESWLVRSHVIKSHRDVTTVLTWITPALDEYEV